MAPSVDDDIQHTARSIMTQFYESLQGGTASLESFLISWSAFDKTVQACQDNLQSETLQMVHDLANMIATVASSMLELEVASDQISLDIESEVTQILDGQLNNLAINDANTMPSGLKDTLDLPLYVKPAYHWLLSNLHNPYPSRQIRNNIARETGAPAKDVEAWFADIRRRIGWNHLRRKYFSNRKEDIINAATEFFKPTSRNVGNKTTTKAESGHDSRFASLLDRAQNLYSGKLFVTPLSIDPDTVTEGVMLYKVSGPQLQKTSSQKSIKSRKDSASSITLSYPSPQYSPCSSPERSTPSPLYPSTMADTTRKRRNSSDSFESGTDSDTRPLKRSRLESSQLSTDLAAASLPSPAASLPDLSGNFFSSPFDPVASVDSPSSIHPSTASSGKRKRRLSDSDRQAPSKRMYHPQSLLARRQVVSNPLPEATRSATELSFDNWFQVNSIDYQEVGHDIPDPVTTDVFDGITFLDIDCYQYESPPYTPEICLQTGTPSTPEIASTISSCPSGTVTSVGGSYKDFEPDFLSLMNELQGRDVDGLLVQDAISSNFDFGSLGMPCTEYEVVPAFNRPEVIQSMTLNISAMPLPPGFEWMSLLDMESNFNGCWSPLNENERATILSDCNSASGFQCDPVAADNTAKRERAQILRDELRRLEEEDSLVALDYLQLAPSAISIQ